MDHKDSSSGVKTPASEANRSPPLSVADNEILILSSSFSVLQNKLIPQAPKGLDPLA